MLKYDNKYSMHIVCQENCAMLEKMQWIIICVQLYSQEIKQLAQQLNSSRISYFQRITEFWF